MGNITIGRTGQLHRTSSRATAIAIKSGKVVKPVKLVKAQHFNNGISGFCLSKPSPGLHFLSAFS